MKRSLQYIRLRQHFPSAAGDEPVTATIDELAAVLNCTHRNVLLILKRMSEEGWLRWTPRRGRGNRSELVFLVTVEDMMLEMARQLTEKKDVRGALEQFGGNHVPEVVRDRFHVWLSSYFGSASEVHGPRRIDLLRFPLSQPYETLDPAYTRYTVESHLASQLFDPLVRVESEANSPIPHLAHAWESSTDGLTWIFYLRKGVLFHDGREMSAEDVVYTLNRLRGLSGRTLYSWVCQGIADVQAIDPNVVQVQLTGRNELFLPFLATVRASIVPSELHGQTSESFGRRPVGTGSYKLERNDRSMCLLTAFPAYFQGRAHIDRVEIWNIPDLYEKAMRQGLPQFQLAHNVRLPGSSWLQVRQQSVSYKFLTMNVREQRPLTDPAVRRALMRLLDRSRLVSHAYGDAAQQASGFLTDHLDASLEPLALNVEELQIIGDSLTLCTIPEYEHDALQVQALFQEAGIQIRLLLLSLERFQSGERLQADLLLFAIMLDQDTELRLVELYKSMLTHIEQPLAAELERILVEVMKEPSKPGRTAMLAKAEGLLTDACVLYVMYRKYLQTAFHPSVAGVRLDSAGWVRFKDIWIKPTAGQSALETPTASSRQN